MEVQSRKGVNVMSKHENERKRTFLLITIPILAIGYQTVLAYFTSMCIYQIGSLITRGTFGIGTVIAFLLVIGFIYLLFRPYKESKSLNINMKRMAGAK